MFGGHLLQVEKPDGETKEEDKVMLDFFFFVVKILLLR